MTRSQDDKGGLLARLKRRYRQMRAWARDNIPPGLRSVLGVVFVALGLVGFLPVVGFWMIPVGLTLIGLDIYSLRRGVRRFKDKSDTPRDGEPDD